MKINIKGIPLNNFPQPNTVSNNPAELMQALRFVRAFMLSDSDWTQVPDSPLDETSKEQWRIWRQELRDLTNEITIFNVGDYFEVNDPPSKGVPHHWEYWEYGKFPTVSEQASLLEANNHDTFNQDEIES